MRKVLVDNHGDDYEVEAGVTGNDLLSLTAVFCIPVTVQVAMLLKVPSVANQSFDQVGYMFDRNVNRIYNSEPSVSDRDLAKPSVLFLLPRPC